MELKPNDLHRCLEVLSEKCTDLQRVMIYYPRQLVVAGGFVRDAVWGDLFKDVDVFVPSESVARSAASVLSSLSQKPPIVARTSVSVCDRGGALVQFSHRQPFADPLEVVGGFDFTTSQGSFWYDGGWKSHVSDHFYPDVFMLRIRYCAPVRDEDPGASLLRLLRLYRRGYRASLETLARVVARFASQSAGSGFLTGASEAEAARLLLASLRAADKSSDVGDPAYTDLAD